MKKFMQKNRSLKAAQPAQGPAFSQNLTTKYKRPDEHLKTKSLYKIQNQLFSLPITNIPSGGIRKIEKIKKQKLQMAKRLGFDPHIGACVGL